MVIPSLANNLACLSTCLKILSRIKRPAGNLDGIYVHKYIRILKRLVNTQFDDDFLQPPCRISGFSARFEGHHDE